MRAPPPAPPTPGIDLVGRIADRGAEFVSAREWMRIWCGSPVRVLVGASAARLTVRGGARARAGGGGGPARSFELLDMLKAHKKGIRRAAVNTFGYIAKAIGPQDVLATLLNNLKVQERQNRVCTTVAIGA